jgi:hypothetical protein
VRAALGHVISEQTDEFDAALESFDRDADRQHAIDLLTLIILWVLAETHDGLPSHHQIAELVQDISQDLASMGATADDVEVYLTTLVNQRVLTDALDTQNVMILSFLIAAYVVAAGSHSEQGEWWFDYLDKAEYGIEETTEQR